jgi:large subunit ribosomal protein L18e
MNRGPESSDVLEVVELLKKKKEGRIWKKVASTLLSPRRNRPSVNVSRIDLYAKENETVVVPGKVLGTGRMTKPVTVAAILFSASARKEIARAGGKCLSVKELVNGNPKGTGVRVMR